MRDLSWFCDTDTDPRYALQEPWVDNGYEYGTNGRIAVRQRTDQADTNDGKKRPRNLGHDLFKPATCTETWPRRSR